MSLDAKELLSELRTVQDPNAWLTRKYQSCTKQEKNSLNEAIGELESLGYLTVFWADDIAYHINIKKDDKVDSVSKRSSENILIIGNNNKIRNSNIGVNNSIVGEQEEKRFWEKHPFALALITAIIAAFIMMFSFWDKIVAFIEGLFS